MDYISGYSVEMVPLRRSMEHIKSPNDVAFELIRSQARIRQFLLDVYRSIRDTPDHLIQLLPLESWEFAKGFDLQDEHDSMFGYDDTWNKQRHILQSLR
jgi:hypothetical protein